MGATDPEERFGFAGRVGRSRGVLVNAGEERETESEGVGEETWRGGDGALSHAHGGLILCKLVYGSAVCQAAFQ